MSGLAFPKQHRRRNRREKRWASGDITEHQLQRLCEEYLDGCGLRWLHIPDSALRACAIGSRVSIGQKREIADYLKGVPDLMVWDDNQPFPRSVLVELKVGTNKRTQAQRDWAALTTVHEIRDFESFKILVDKFRGMN